MREQDLTPKEDRLLRRLGRLTKAGIVDEFRCYWDARAREVVCKPVLVMRPDDEDDPLTLLHNAA